MIYFNFSFNIVASNSYQAGKTGTKTKEKKLQPTMSKCLAKSTKVTESVLQNVLQTSVLSQRNCALYEFYFYCSSLVIVNC